MQVAREIGGAYAHILHTVPQESEVFRQRPGVPHRGPLYGHEKAKAQFAVARESQLVVGVGPKISDFASLALPPTGPPVHELLPGLNTELLAYRPDINRLRRFHCLMSARMNDAWLKGARLACDAVKRAATGRDGRERPKLILRGLTPDGAVLEFDQIGKFDDYQAYVELRAYTDDFGEVHRDLQASSLVVMPSLSEGFGLSAFEAIAAGVPVVLTFESGLAEYLLRAIDEGIVERGIRDSCIARVTGASQVEIVDEWSAKVTTAIADREDAFRRAQRLRAALQPVLTWRHAAEEFTKAVNAILTSV